MRKVAFLAVGALLLAIGIPYHRDWSRERHEQWVQRGDRLGSLTLLSRAPNPEKGAYELHVADVYDSGSRCD